MPVERENNPTIFDHSLITEVRRAETQLFNFVCGVYGYDLNRLALWMREEIHDECTRLIENWDAALRSGIDRHSMTAEIQRLLADRWEAAENVYATRLAEAFGYPCDPEFETVAFKVAKEA